MFSATLLYVGNIVVSVFVHRCTDVLNAGNFTLFVYTLNYAVVFDIVCVSLCRRGLWVASWSDVLLVCLCTAVCGAGFQDSCGAPPLFYIQSSLSVAQSS